jgi:SAM-dependent methyltransferase
VKTKIRRTTRSAQKFELQPPRRATQSRPSHRTYRLAKRAVSLLQSEQNHIVSKQRILVAIASYGTRNDSFLLQLVREYRAMSFDVDIVVLSNLPKEVAPGVEVRVVDLHGKDPWSLPFPHKELFASKRNDYELFIYSEDDTLITEKNLHAFLDASSVLPQDEIAGFLRFEECPDGTRNFPELHGHFHWDPQSVRSRGNRTFAHLTNEHSACYVLTREQLRRAIASGGYLVAAHQGKYDLLCTCATDPYTQCGFRKLICISRIEDFCIHHLPNKYVGGVFGVGETELRGQLETLARVGSNGHRPASLFPTETRLWAASYSKSYYEPARAEVLAAISEDARSVLSIGCGSGAAEAVLVARGKRVVALPLDPVIGGVARANGVEIVCGDFPAARQKLTGERFDSLLVSNVLHLVPDPAYILKSFSALLSDQGKAVIVLPNILRLSLYWRKFRGDEHLRDLGNYGKTGVHLTSHGIVKHWLREAGMKPLEFKDVLTPRARQAGRLTLGLMAPFLSSEFVVVAARAESTVRLRK